MIWQNTCELRLIGAVIPNSLLMNPSVTTLPEYKVQLLGNLQSPTRLAFERRLFRELQRRYRRHLPRRSRHRFRKMPLLPPALQSWEAYLAFLQRIEDQGRWQFLTVGQEGIALNTLAQRGSALFWPYGVFPVINQAEIAHPGDRLILIELKRPCLSVIPVGLASPPVGEEANDRLAREQQNSSETLRQKKGRPLAGTGRHNPL